LAPGCQSISIKSRCLGRRIRIKASNAYGFCRKPRRDRTMSEPGTEMEALPKLALKY
jgi:hypothetical protein